MFDAGHRVFRTLVPEGSVLSDNSPNQTDLRDRSCPQRCLAESRRSQTNKIKNRYGRSMAAHLLFRSSTTCPNEEVSGCSRALSRHLGCSARHRDLHPSQCPVCCHVYDDLRRVDALEAWLLDINFVPGPGSNSRRSKTHHFHRLGSFFRCAEVRQCDLGHRRLRLPKHP